MIIFSILPLPKFKHSRGFGFISSPDGYKSKSYIRHALCFEKPKLAFGRQRKIVCVIITCTQFVYLA
jgi:hypothetical protein